MARNVQLGTLVTKVRQRADYENNQHVTDVEIKGLISDSVAWFRDLLVESGLAYFEDEETWTTAGATPHILAQPADFRSELRVDYQPDAETYLQLRAIDVADVHRYSKTGDRATAYRVVGSNVVLYPQPPIGQAYRMLYIPAPPDLSAAADATTIDGISGWEELVILDAAIKVLRKEGGVSSTSGLERDLQRQIDRVIRARDERQMRTNGHVRDAVGDDSEIDPASIRDYRRVD